MPLSLPPDTAWLPLPSSNWNPEAARHLLRRVGWTAEQPEVERSVHDGLGATLERIFPTNPPLFAKPRSISELEAAAPALAREVKDQTGEQKARARREAQERERFAIQDLSLKWLAYAAQPTNAAFAKWTLFLSDVYVVSAEKVRHAPLIYDHFDVLGRHGLGPAPVLTKAVSRSPAMVIYLDLNQNQRQAPNENFARELFELFVLGEGNYTERDIKEAARAFTGYRAQPAIGEFRFAPKQHDPSSKTVFGAKGAFDGDDIIDLAYRQKAAASFLPHELVKFYLSDTPLPPEYLAALGAAWRNAGLDLRWLAHHFFGSQLFFAPEFRSNFIKSPIQFELGLIRDLRLDVSPLARMALNPLRQMGQLLFFPPNVRGWVGGRNWINSATITARRQLVEMLFRPINEESLNADELADLAAAEAAGSPRFTVSDEQLAAFAASSGPEAAAKLVNAFLPSASDTTARTAIEQFITTDAPHPQQRLRTLRRAAATLLQSPQYQLC